MKLYHNAACSKSRATITKLQSKYPDLQVINYLETPPTQEVIIDMIARSDSPAEDFIRWADARLLGLKIDDKNNSEHVAQLIVSKPKIMQRPLVDTGDKVIICRNEDLLNAL